MLLVVDCLRSLVSFDNSPLVGAFYSLVAVTTTAAIALLLGPFDTLPQLAALAGPLGTLTAGGHDTHSLQQGMW